MKTFENLSKTFENLSKSFENLSKTFETLSKTFENLPKTFENLASPNRHSKIFVFDAGVAKSGSGRSGAVFSGTLR